jgi:ubiquitin 3 binding protein But2-like protein
VSTIFNFDIPSGDAGRQCSLQFLFPNSEDLTTSSYSFSGDGNVQFGMLQSIATQSTTYNTSPPVSGDYSNITLVPGNSYTITTISCPAGQAIAFEMKSSSGTELNYFQNSGPPPYVKRHLSNGEFS